MVNGKVVTRRVGLITELIAPYRIPVFNALARHAGVDLHVIFLTETDTMLRKWSVYTNEILFSYEVLPSWRLRAGKRTLLLHRGLRSALRAARPETVICGGYNYLASWEALKWAGRHNVRFVLWSESNLQDSRTGNAVLEHLKRYFVRACDAFVVPGRSSLGYLHSLGADPQAISTAPNAVDNWFFAAQANLGRAHAAELRQKRNLPRRFVLCAARLVPEKGIFDLLEAYAKLDNSVRSEVGLVFAGDGSARAKLIEFAQNVHPGTISFPGFVQREELAILYSLAEALVLPTHSDPWGLVVNEAMACGLPVVVTSVAGCAADLVENGWNGYVVPPANPEKLREAIDYILRNTESRREMGERSLERIREYSPEACASGLAAAAFPAERQVQCTG
jgi:glycosyltransferase involved in cell wall biosynthesis